MKKHSFLFFSLAIISITGFSQTLTQTIKGKLYDSESQSAI
jgi:hypothetical protein